MIVGMTTVYPWRHGEPVWETTGDNTVLWEKIGLRASL
jgi:hypothetical protein